MSTSLSGKTEELTLEQRIKQVFRTHSELTTTEIMHLLGYSQPNKDIFPVLNKLEQESLIIRQALSGGRWISKIYSKDMATALNTDPRIPHDITFLDWNNVIPQLMHCYEHKIFPLTIGPKGVGKTAAIRKLAEIMNQPIEIMNLSLRAREHHFIGRLDPQKDGSVTFKLERFAKSMDEGIMMNIDEMNAAEPDVLLRLDEALDDRHELRVEDRIIKAKPSWFCVASINPLNHAGTKELPPQLISRFPVRIHFDYPDIDNEIAVVRSHCPNLKGEQVANLRKLVEAVQQLRTQDLPYTPSLRETVTMGQLISVNTPMKNIVNWTLVNVYYQYDSSVADKVKELLISRGLSVT